MTRELKRAYVAPYDSWKHRIAILRFVQDIPLRPADRGYELVSWVQDRLHLLRSVPMLILWGMKDFVFDHHFLDEWVRYFPEAQVHRFPQAGHYLFEDEARRDQWLGARLSRGPPRHPGARRLSQTSAPVERTNIAIHLSRMAMRQPHTMAVVVPDGRDQRRPRPLHAPDLPAARPRQQSDRARPEGIRYWPRREGRGDGPAGARLFLARVRSVQGGRRARVNRPRDRTANLGQCCREAEPEVFIGIPKALLARRIFGWGRKTVRQTILVAPGGAGRFAMGVKTLDDVRRAEGDARGQKLVAASSIALLSAEETAAILFTSGSTGPPRAPCILMRSFRRRSNRSARSTPSSQEKSICVRSRSLPCSRPRSE